MAQMLPPLAWKELPANAITGHFIHTSANHEQSSVNVVLVGAPLARAERPPIARRVR